MTPETLFWSALPVLEVGWVLVATVYLVLQRRSASATIAWIFALALLPGIGIAIYFIFGPRRFEKRKARRARARAAVRGRSVQDAAVKHDLNDQAKHLIRLCENTVGFAARPRIGQLEFLNDGSTKYAALEAAIRAAKHHVHLEYYIWEPDQTGTRLRDVLVERAKAGVAVRVLVDGFGSSKAHDDFWRPLRSLGGEVHRFNALTWTRWRPRMANFRTHRKIVVIDGFIGFTGGMNVSDVHTEDVSGDRAWRDLHVRVEGRAVRGLQLVFFEDWHYATGETPPAEIVENEEETAPGSRLLQIVSSGPDENLDAIHKLYFAAITAAHERVLLTTPYFVPDSSVTEALMAAALRGADVRVLVPAAGDVPLVAAAARSYYPELLDVGVRIFEYNRTVLHAKTLVVDDYLAVVGTANVDNRSFRLNFEVVLAAFDSDTCTDLARRFAEDLSHSSEVTKKRVASRPFTERLLTSSARLLSPIL